eukprot:gene12701-biopygen3457
MRTPLCPTSCWNSADSALSNQVLEQVRHMGLPAPTRLPDFWAGVPLPAVPPLRRGVSDVRDAAEAAEPSGEGYSVRRRGSVAAQRREPLLSDSLVAPGVAVRSDSVKHHRAGVNMFFAFTELVCQRGVFTANRSTQWVWKIVPPSFIPHNTPVGDRSGGAPFLLHREAHSDADSEPNCQNLAASGAAPGPRDALQLVVFKFRIAEMKCSIHKELQKYVASRITLEVDSEPNCKTNGAVGKIGVRAPGSLGRGAAMLACQKNTLPDTENPQKVTSRILDRRLRFRHTELQLQLWRGSLEPGAAPLGRSHWPAKNHLTGHKNTAKSDKSIEDVVPAIRSLKPRGSLGPGAAPLACQKPHHRTQNRKNNKSYLARPHSDLSNGAICFAVWLGINFQLWLGISVRMRFAVQKKWSPPAPITDRCVMWYEGRGNYFPNPLCTPVPSKDPPLADQLGECKEHIDSGAVMFDTVASDLVSVPKAMHFRRNPCKHTNMYVCVYVRVRMCVCMYVAQSIFMVSPPHRVRPGCPTGAVRGAGLQQIRDVVLNIPRHWVLLLQPRLVHLTHPASRVAPQAAAHPPRNLGAGLAPADPCDGPVPAPGWTERSPHCSSSWLDRAESALFQHLVGQSGVRTVPAAGWTER